MIKLDKIFKDTYGLTKPYKLKKKASSISFMFLFMCLRGSLFSALFLVLVFLHLVLKVLSRSADALRA